MSLPFIADGYGLDRAIAAMWCHAKHGETVSLQAARAQKDGRLWGCVLCRVLDRLVERGHCTMALDPDMLTARPAAYRAGALLVVLGVALWAVPLILWRLIARV